MKSNTQNDAKLIRKARFRVTMAMTGAFILLCAYFIGLYYILNLGIFEKPPGFDMLYMISMVAEILVWLFVFVSMDSGSPKMRYVYYGCEVLEFLWTFYIFYMGYQAATGQLCCFAWGLISLVKIYGLYAFGSWLKNSYWAKIFFDKTIIVFGKEEAQAQSQQPAQPQPVKKSTKNKNKNTPQNYQQTQGHVYTQNGRTPSYQSPGTNINNSGYQNYPQQGQSASGMSPRTPGRQPSYQSGTGYASNQQARTNVMPSNAVSQNRQPAYASQAQQPRRGPSTKEVMNSIKVKVMTYPVLAVRLGAVVYGEMILFPIIAELLKSFLMSTNGRYNFVTTGIFTLAIISAAIWTLAIFFLYLKLPASRKIVWVCVAAEIVMNFVYYWFVIRNIQASDQFYYMGYVYVVFWVLDVLRYPLIVWALLPLWRIPVPRADESALADNDETEEEAEHYASLFEGEEEDEVSPSLKEALITSYDVLKDKTAQAISTGMEMAKNASHSSSEESEEPHSDWLNDADIDIDIDIDPDAGTETETETDIDITQPEQTPAASDESDTDSGSEEEKVSDQETDKTPEITLGSDDLLDIPSFGSRNPLSRSERNKNKSN